jgi:threonine dehydratase
MNPATGTNPVTREAIEAARLRIDGVVAVTPCPESIALSELTCCRAFCKLEYLQRTGAGADVQTGQRTDRRAT